MANKRFTLLHFLMRPLETFKRARRIFNSIEIETRVLVKDGLKEEDLPDDGFVVYSSIAIPVTTWRLIRPSLTKVDYQFVTGGKVWELKDDQNIHTNVLTKDDMTAMHVAKRFKDAS